MKLIEEIRGDIEKSLGIFQTVSNTLFFHNFGGFDMDKEI